MLGKTVIHWLQLDHKHAKLQMMITSFFSFPLFPLKSYIHNAFRWGFIDIVRSLKIPSKRKKMEINEEGTVYIESSISYKWCTFVCVLKYILWSTDAHSTDWIEKKGTQIWCQTNLNGASQTSKDIYLLRVISTAVHFHHVRWLGFGIYDLFCCYHNFKLWL